MLPEITFTEFKKLTAHEIKELKSFVVTFNGYYWFTVVIPQTPYVKEGVMELCILSNAVGGKEVEREKVAV